MSDVVISIPGATNVDVTSAPVSSVVVTFPASNNFVVSVIDRGVLYGIKGDPGVGVNAGGSTGQALVKKSDDDYDTEWAEILGGVTSVNGKTGDVTIDKEDVGLGNVDNTSDLDKPISTATQTALNGKQNTLVSGTNIKTVNGEDILGSGNISIPTYIARHDFQNTYDYLGKALTGSSESSNVWTITRLTLSPNGSATIGTATSVAWTNRYSVIYT